MIAEILSPSVQSIATEVVLLIGLATAIIGLLTKGYFVVKRIEQAIGVDEQGRTIAQRLDQVEATLTPPDGEPLKKQVMRLEKDVDALGVVVRRLSEEVTLLSLQITNLGKAVTRSEHEKK